MGVTIDSLQIEIQSNSQGAAQGIDALAKSLGELKKNGTISVAVKNLDKLSDSLKKFTTLSDPSHKIRSLTSAMLSLKEVGSVASIANSLTKLGGAMKSVHGMDLEGVAPKIQAIASALGPLSDVKAGGLGTLVNSLKKLDEVTGKLDDATISRFAERVQKLSNELGPLSTKMASISTGFKAINSSASKAATGVSGFNSKVKVGTLNLSNFIISVQGIVTALQPVIRLLTEVIGEAIEWDGIAQRFGRGFGSQAQETYAWIQRLNEEMGINVQQFMQYSSTYATMLTGFGVANEDASKMALGYTELTYDIWAGYNDIYKNYADAADAVRSAIAGEVEPIRRAGFTIVESTLEQTAANHGLEISLEKATEAQKSYLRYLTLVDQAHAQNLVGTYAREMNTAEGVVRTLSQQLKSLAQSFGSLFLPILVKVIPWLQVFVDLLTEAVVAVASFFGIEIQPIDWGGFNSGAGSLEGVGDAADNATDSLGGVTDGIEDTTEALKDLKKATIGIDELNVISPPSTSGGADGSGGAGGGAGGAGGSGFPGLDVDSLWDESIFDSIQSKVDGIKEKLKEWLPVIEIIGASLAGLGIATLLKNLGEALAQMNLLQKLFATVTIVAIEAALVFKFADNYLESGNLLNLVGEAVVTAVAGYLLFKAWGPAGIVLALGVSILAQLVAIEANLADGTVSLSSEETWIQALTTTLMGAFGGLVLSKYTAFFPKEGFVIGLGVTATLVLVAIRTGALSSGEIKSDSVEAWIMTIGSTITAALAGKWLGAALYAGGGPLGALIGVTAGLILNLVTTIAVKGENFGNEVSDWILAGLATFSAAFTVKKVWAVIGPTVTTVFQGVAAKIGALIAGSSATSGIAGALSSALTTAATNLGLGTAGAAAAALAAAVVGIVAGIPTFIKGIYNSLTEGIDWMSAALTAAGATAAGAGIGAIIGSLGGPIGAGIGALIGLAVGLVTDGIILVVQKWDAITEFLHEFFTVTVPGVWDSFVKWIDDLPEEIEQWFDDLWQPIKDYDWEGLGYDIGHWLGSALKSAIDFVTVDIPKWLGEVWSAFKTGIKVFFTETLPKFFTETIPSAWESVKSAFKTFFTETLPTFIFETIPSAWNKFVDIGKAILDGIWEGICSIGTAIADFVDGFIQGFKDAFGIHSPSKKMIEIGKELLAGLLNPFNLEAIKKRVAEMWNTAKDWWGEAERRIDASIGLIKSGWSTVRTWVLEKSNQVKDKISQGVSLAKSGWSTVKDWIGKIPGVSQAVGLVKSGWSSVKGWVGSIPKLSQTIGLAKSGWSSVSRWIGSIPKLSQKIGLLKSGWSSVSRWIGTMPSLSAKIRLAKSGWSSVKSWLGSLDFKLNFKLPKIGVKWGTKEVLGWEISYPSGFYTYAKGGFPDIGEMFIAREAGPEMVGRIGNKTTVANNEQIVEAISEGVYAAVTAAMRASGDGSGDRNINLYLDGRQIYASMEQRRHEKGASIMGNQVYSYG